MVVESIVYSWWQIAIDHLPIFQAALTQLCMFFWLNVAPPHILNSFLFTYLVAKFLEENAYAEQCFLIDRKCLLRPFHLINPHIIHTMYMYIHSGFLLLACYKDSSVSVYIFFTGTRCYYCTCTQ